MTLPVQDWQFWAATFIAVLALRHVARMIFPSGIPLMRRRGRVGRRATLTVERKPVDLP